MEEIGRIQGRTEEQIRLSAVRIKQVGGEDALADYLQAALCAVLGVAIAEQGLTRARRLMAEGFLMAEQYPAAELVESQQ